MPPVIVAIPDFWVALFAGPFNTYKMTGTAAAPDPFPPTPLLKVNVGAVELLYPNHW